MVANILEYQKQFQEKGQVTIDSLFPEPQAEEIYLDYLTNPKFKVGFWTGEEVPGEGIPIQYAGKGTHRYNQLTDQVYNLAANNLFSYRFSRTQHVHPYLYNLWDSPMFSEVMGFITGQKGLKWVKDSTFTSKYEAGDFLYTHTDKGNGRIAFVYQLTKNWKPGFGGLFLKANNWFHPDVAVLPEFNKLTIFDVTNEGTPHCVTQVMSNLKECRIAYSGWLA